jgi:hypothetical protein
VRDLRRAAETNPHYPPVLLVYQGTVEEGGDFFAKLWPEARAIANPDRDLYAAFGIERGHSQQLLSAGVIACGIRATLKGNFNGRPQGDPRLMPGLFLVADDTIVWHHDYRHAGDHPDFAALPALFPHPASVATR